MKQYKKIISKRKKLITRALSACFLLTPSLVFAGHHATVDSGDTAWMMTATALVLFMTIPGLSLFYAGLVRSKNVLSVLMQCFSITCLASLMWLVFGYSLAFGDGGSMNEYIGGFGNLFLQEVTRTTVSGTIPETVFVMFQLTFAIITPALVVGGFAERMRFSSMLLFTAVWSILVYYPICHWVWGGGWLGEIGVLDFAGGLVVHLTAGVGAVVAAIVMGSRAGFPSEPMTPHNLALSVAGAGMLWVGWFGFNAGSALASGGDAGMAMLVTHISAALASLTWMFFEWRKYGKPSVLGIITGMVAGLGTITPASGFVGPMGAAIIGTAAGAVCFIATNFMKQTLKIDDSLDVFPVHGVGGALGTILVGVFVASQFGGAGLGDNETIGSQLTTQVLGVLFVLSWTVIATYVGLKIVDSLTGLRVSNEDEHEGLDISMHEEKGYNM
jgi:Amt family ammonium transporter